MDIATIIGLVGGAIIVFFGIITGPDGLSSLGHFADTASVIITLGGSTICMFMQSKGIPEFFANVKSFKLALKKPNADEAEVINNIVNLSNVARKEGLLALEEMANNIEDEFLKKGIMLIVDGTDPELVRNIMETELMSLDRRHNEKIGFWANWGGMGPAWGMIGTLIGLVNMLYNMEDMSSIGPNMAVALLTTLYGSLLANWVCIPVSFKLKTNNELEISIKEVMVEGLLSIQAGENPRVIEEKLKSFLAPSTRDAIGADANNGAAATEGGES
ncbi:MAG: motility protein A [Butyribacter sp.]|nr:motility protein A [bacterium]MDY3855258.1 motility protein A [Butyribacter sp.]